MRFPFARLRERLAARDVLRLRGRFRGRRGLVAFLAVMGPGLIAGIAGNDAGGITTYSVMGATTGLSLLWIFPITIVILAIVQEMAARLGVVTGQGLSDLIRDRFGVRPTAFAMIILLIANVANTVAEFSGAAASLELFGISRYIAVPIVGVAIWALVIKASYRTVERVFLSVIVVFVTYIFSAILADPDWGAVGRALVTPHLDLAPAQLLLVVAVVGTTITPYMQFYLTSAVAEKGIGEDELGLERADAIGGSIWTNVIAIFIVVAAAATIGVGGRHDHLGRRRGQGAGARRRSPGRGALRGRVVRRERAGGDDHAALHGLRDLRGVRLGIGRRQALQRRPGVLLDLHVRAGCRGTDRADPGPGPAAGDHRLAEPAGPPAAGRARVHGPAGQRRAADGRAPQRARSGTCWPGRRSGWLSSSTSSCSGSSRSGSSGSRSAEAARALVRVRLAGGGGRGGPVA